MTGKRRSALNHAGQSRPRLAVLMTAMVAVFLQALVVQTHFHAMAPIGAAAGYTQSIQTGDGSARASVAHDQVACAVCVLVTISGRAALPDAANLVAEHATSYEPTSQRIRGPPIAPVHHWQSRAPPIAL